MSNKYIEQIFEKIEKNKRMEKEELSSDKACIEQSKKMNFWYDELKQKILENPPIAHVKQIIVYEDACDYITRIEYKYCDAASKYPSYPTILICTSFQNNK